MESKGVDAAMSPDSRIAIYLPSLRGGGAERVMVTLANGFAVRGYPVDLLLVKAEGPYLADVSEDVRVVDLNASRVITSLPGLVRYLWEVRPEALLSAMGHVNIVAVASRMLARVPTRVVVSERANFSLSQKNSPSWRGRNTGVLKRWAYMKADGIIAISGGVAVDLAQNLGLPRSSIQVVYNPAATGYIMQQSKQLPNHPWLYEGEPPVILGIGRLVPQKNFELLIKAFNFLLKQHEARLLILGEGPLRPELEQLVNELDLKSFIDLPGFVNNPYAYMRHASMFVLSSGWEGFGNVLVEAMACGTPVVSTDCPSGPAEILENGKWGRLVPVGDVHALAEAMAATLDEPEHPDFEGRAADFNVDQAVEGYLQALFPQKEP